jgi:hypothetical protein
MRTALAKSGEQQSTREMLEALEEAIETLRVAYEKYFAGVDKAAPVKQRSRVERQVRLLDGLAVRSTVLRFKIGGLRARFVTYKHYWTRVEREIERGVSRRDLMRTRGAMGGLKRPPAAVEQPAAPTAPPAAAAAAKDAAPPLGPSVPRVPPPPPVGPLRHARAVASPGGPKADGLDPGHLQEVYRSLVQAKKAAGESMDGLTYAALCRKLAREAPRVKEKHKCEQVRFEVQTVDGRVRLRALPS